MRRSSPALDHDRDGRRHATSVANVWRYAYLDTRVSGMAAHLLRPGQLEDLVEHPIDADTSRKLALAPGSEHDARLTGQHATSVLLDELAVLVRAVRGAERDFLTYWAHRFELRNLKTLLRGKMADRSNAAIRDELFDMGALGTLPMEELLQTEDVAELLRRLERTPHADLARQARILHDEHHGLFAIDAALDKQYYTELAKRAGRIHPRHAPLFHELLGTRMDRVNLIWLLRYRFAYDLPPIQTFYLLVPAGLRLGVRTLQALTQLGTFEDVIGKLPEPLHSKLKPAANAFEASLLMEEETRRVARVALRARFGFTPAFAYLLLREDDLRRIRAVLEGKRLELDATAIRASLGVEGRAPQQH